MDDVKKAREAVEVAVKRWTQSRACVAIVGPLLSSLVLAAKREAWREAEAVALAVEDGWLALDDHERPAGMEYDDGAAAVAKRLRALAAEEPGQ